MKHLLWIGLAAAPMASAAATFNSPNGLTEECRILPPLPGGEYSDDDTEDEGKLCSVDFYATTSVALCPKTWSTSPGTMVYDITASGLSQAEYEARPECGGSKKGHEKITKFKQTMHQSGTSGTFSAASLLYYHVSRYFDATVDIPVSVFRTMDRQAHFDRVTKRAHEGDMGKGRMNKAGWKWLYEAEQDPTRYRPTEELFTDENRQIFGVLGEGGGERYGPEINGVRSGGPEQQHRDFQETPAFLALRSAKPLKEAIAEGLERGQRDRQIREAMGGGASDFQMAVWMKELSELVIMDYIFSQQDRIGNIDYKWYYYWRDADGKVRSKKLDSEEPRSDMARIEYPREVDGSPTVLVQRTRMNDNDAAGKPAYTNFAKRTQMLEKVRHLDRKTYDKLVELSADLETQGPVFQSLSANFGLSERQLQMIVANAVEAAAILKATVDRGEMQFDLDGVKDLFKDLN